MIPTRTIQENNELREYTISPQATYTVVDQEGREWICVDDCGGPADLYNQACWSRESLAYEPWPVTAIND